MCTNHVNVNLGFSEELFPAGPHVCLIYNSEEERNDVISKFIEAGLKNNEKWLTYVTITILMH